MIPRYLVLMVLILLSCPVLAQESIDIQDIADVVIYGAGYQDNLGKWISGAGDVNGDGIDDFLLGTDEAIGSDLTNFAYIIFGSRTMPATIDLLDATVGISRIGNLDGPATVAGLGDFNQDGFEDVLIGNKIGSPNDVFFAGDARIINGSSALPVEIDYKNMTVSNIFITGYRLRSALSTAVSGVGDINGDGFTDALISAYGSSGGVPSEAFLIYGGTQVPNLLETPAIAPYGIRIEGTNLLSSLGRVVAGPGDVNGDGLPDMLLAANAATEGVTDHTYLIYGATDLPSQIKAGELGDLGVDFYNADPYNISGRSISAVGEVNGDGYRDFMIAEWGATIGGIRSGRVALLYGRSDFHGEVDLNQLEGYGVYINGVQEHQQFGGVLGHLGDINLDGRDDLVIGTTSDDSEARCFLFYNQPKLRNPGVEVSYRSLDRVLVQSQDPGESFGAGVANIGDVNGDGLDDFAFGERFADPYDRFAAGKVYVVFGRAGLFESLFQRSDINQDGEVDHEDLFILQSHWLEKK